MAFSTYVLIVFAAGIHYISLHSKIECKEITENWISRSLPHNPGRSLEKMFRMHFPPRLPSGDKHLRFVGSTTFHTSIWSHSPQIYMDMISDKNFQWVKVTKVVGVVFDHLLRGCHATATIAINLQSLEDV